MGVNQALVVATGLRVRRGQKISCSGRLEAASVLINAFCRGEAPMVLLLVWFAVL
jgi:hypothetical protein